MSLITKLIDWWDDLEQAGEDRRVERAYVDGVADGVEDAKQHVRDAFYDKGWQDGFDQVIQEEE